MVSRDEICNALAYLVQVMSKCIDPNQEIEIKGDTVTAGSVLRHADELHAKLMQEKDDMGGGGMVAMTQDAYLALMKKIEVCDRVNSAPMMAEASAGEGRPS